MRLSNGRGTQEFEKGNRWEDTINIVHAYKSFKDQKQYHQPMCHK